jgi:hypothetical protein
VAIEVMTWVWKNSRSKNTARLVLLAIADCARADGSHAFPSNPELREKANASERAVQDSIKALVELGELEVQYNRGPKGVNLYRVIMTRAGSTPRRIRTPAGSAGGGKRSSSKGTTPQNSPPPAESAPPQKSTATPAESAPGTVIGTVTTEVLRTSESRRRKTAPAEADPETAARNELAKRILDWWWEQLSIKPSGKGAYHSSLRVLNNLLAVGHEPKAIASAARAIGAPITTGRMEIELGRNGRAGGGNALALANGHAPRLSTTDQRVADVSIAVAAVEAEIYGRGAA